MKAKKEDTELKMMSESIPLTKPKNIDLDEDKHGEEAKDIEESKKKEKKEKIQEYSIIVLSVVIFIPLVLVITILILLIEPILEYSKLAISPQCLYEEYEDLLGTLNHTKIFSEFENFSSENFIGDSIFHEKLKGTFRSYHKQPTFLSAVTPGSDFYYNDLFTQLNINNVRSIELDLHFASALGKNAVYNTIVDLRTTCLCASDCFRDIDLFINSKNGAINNHVTFVFLNMRSAGELESSCTSQSFQVLFDELFLHFNPQDVIVPKMITRNYTSIVDAIENEGWPNIASTSGKVMFILEVSQDNSECIEVYESFSTKYFFISSGQKKINDFDSVIVEESEDAVLIASYLSKNYIVKCNVGMEKKNLQFCIDSGAHILISYSDEDEVLKDGNICNAQTTSC